MPESVFTARRRPDSWRHDVDSTMTINGVAPYWRLAWEQAVGDGTLEVGTYGMVNNAVSQ